MTSYAVIGTGALGGYYGARLAQSGAEVHFLCHRDAPWVREHGLVVDSPGRGMLHVRAQAYGEASDLPRCDVALVALKTTANHQLAGLLPYALKPDGVALVMQNGLDVERDAADAIPGHLILGGLCFIGANKTGPGRILHLDYGHVLLGWHEATGDGRTAEAWMDRIAREFEAARVPVARAGSLRSARWRKLVWNVAYNGLSVIHNATTGVIMQTPALRAEAVALMREVQSIAAADGHPIEDAFIQEMIDVTDRMKPYKTSMLLDREAGKPLELEVIYARPLRIAAALGVSVPRMESLFGQLATRLAGTPKIHPS